MSDRRGESESAGTSPSGGPTMIDVTPTQGAEPENTGGAHHKSTSRSVAAMSALATLVLALATSPYWAPPVASVLPWGSAPEAKSVPTDTTALQSRVGALETKLGELAQGQQRVTALDRRVGQLEQRPAPAPNSQDAQQSAQQTQALGDRLSTIEQRIGTLAAATSSQTAADATKGLQSEIQTLSQKLDEQSQLLAKLQSQERGGADRTGAALVVTLGQLRAALATSHPYAAELQAAEALAKDQPDTLAELHKLDGRAQQGVPTLAILTQQFEAITRSAAPVSAPPAADGGWGARTLAKLKSLVSVRRVGDASGDKTETSGRPLAEAEAALKNGDLAAAVVAMRRAAGSASPVAASWLEDAQARLDTEATLTATDATILKRFLTEPGAGAKP
jgi:hypothetical protein